MIEQTPDDRFDLLDTIWTTGFASLFPDAGDDLDSGLAAIIRSAGTISGAELAAAHLQRRLYMIEMEQLLAPYDVAVTATCAVPPFAPGADGPASVGGELTNYLEWAWLTYTFNLTEHPALSLPCSTTQDGLPVGIQLVGHHGRDHELAAAAAALEPVVRAPSREASP